MYANIKLHMDTLADRRRVWVVSLRACVIKINRYHTAGYIDIYVLLNSATFLTVYANHLHFIALATICIRN